MSREYAKAVGARLRAIRIQQGLSLQGVEQKSRGRWKTAAVGSYERGDRMISVHQLSELAGFYGVPVSALLPNEDSLPPRERRPRTVLNLERLASAPPDSSALVRRWVSQIQRQRDDYAGRVLSIREGDLRALALLHDTTPQEFSERLRGWGVLGTEFEEPEEKPE
jgi:transcriptional regulator with XRE-family HTH domain